MGLLEAWSLLFLKPFSDFCLFVILWRLQFFCVKGERFLCSQRCIFVIFHVVPILWLHNFFTCTYSLKSFLFSFYSVDGMVGNF